MADDIGKVFDKIREVVKAVDEAKREAVREELAEVVADLKRAAPEDTGNLKSKIKGRMNKAGDGAEAASEADYTNFVVHGTSTHKAHDFMTPVAEESRRRYPDRMRAALKEKLAEVARG